MNFSQDRTTRGFDRIQFTDAYDDACVIQKSSLATDQAIWFGIQDANPHILASKTPEGGVGWVPYDIPADVQLTTRMHLTQAQVRTLLPILQGFADHGELPQNLDGLSVNTTSMNHHIQTCVDWLTTADGDFTANLIELEGFFQSVPDEVSDAFAELTSDERVEVIYRASSQKYSTISMQDTSQKG